MGLDTGLRAVQETLTGENDRAFFERIWTTPQSIYRERVRAVRFSGLSSVLDAGCGFAQWSLALASENSKVLGIDVSGVRIQAARKVASYFNVENVQFMQGRIEDLSQKNSFDGIFAYSTLYLTDYRRTLRTLAGALKTGGLLYFSTNGLGWYLHNLVEGRNDTSDFHSKQAAADAIAHSLEYYSRGVFELGKQLIMPSHLTRMALQEAGLHILEMGPDGSIGKTDCCTPAQFFPPAHFGFEGVYEVLCQKL
jgi:2-polyprenyl-3-methyl-5-hydroxy-6-metoxy-1,4-benzoquinol methylase